MMKDEKSSKGAAHVVAACAIAMAVSALFLTGPATAEEKLDPPGTCGWKTYNELSELKKAACNLVRTCGAADSCEDLSNKAKAFQLCIDTRTALSNTCFRGGDQRHKDAVSELASGKKTCDTAYAAKVAAGQCRIGLCPSKP